MDKNIMDKQSAKLLWKIKTYFIQWSEESFQKELPFYNRLGIFQDGKIPSSYNDFINTISGKGGLKKFLVSLGKNTIGLNYTGSGSKSDFSLELGENHFLSIITDNDFYNQYFIEAKEAAFKKVFSKSFDDWFKNINWEELSLSIRINDTYKIQKLLSKDVEKNMETNIQQYISKNAFQVVNKDRENRGLNPLDEQRRLMGKEGNKEKGALDKKWEITYNTGTTTISLKNNNNYYLTTNINDYYLMPLNKKIFRDLMYSYAYSKVEDKGQLIDLSKAYQSFKNSLKKDIDNDKDSLIDIIKQGICQGLERTNSKASKFFLNWWKDNGVNELLKKKIEILGNTETELERIGRMVLGASTGKLYKGNLGEVFCKLLIEIAMKLKNEDKDEVTYITGGIRTEKGTQHAVDLMVKFKNAKNNLESVGAQVKTFPSAEEEGYQTFYQQSNLIGDDDINRYLGLGNETEPKGNEILKRLLTIYLKNKKEKYYNWIEAFLFSKTDNYIRYKEGNPIKDKYKDIENLKNNFYIFNFRIIPASLIFYFLAQSLSVQNIPNIFYFSKKEEKTNDNDSNNNNKRENLCKNLKESLNIYDNNDDPKKYDASYLNFVGITLRFKGITGNNLVSFNIK